MAFIVDQQYRTSELSFIPSGYSVIVIFEDWFPGPLIREYNNIQYPYAYIRSIADNPEIKNAYVKNKKKFNKPLTK